MKHNIIEWVNDHDDKWLFTLLYVSSAIVLSMTISMFWLVIVVAVHGLLEWISISRSSSYYGIKRFGAVLWHLKLDIVLIIFALWLSVYMDAIFGLVGLNAAARAGAQVGSRFAIFEKIIRGFFLTVDDAAQVLKALSKKRDKSDQEVEVKTYTKGDCSGQLNLTRVYGPRQMAV
ncbi:hypothetical protein ACQKPX_13320 [Photobacterium sp. DNB23_23_1]